MSVDLNVHKMKRPREESESPLDEEHRTKVKIRTDRVAQNALSQPDQPRSQSDPQDRFQFRSLTQVLDKTTRPGSDSSFFLMQQKPIVTRPTLKTPPPKPLAPTGPCPLFDSTRIPSNSAFQRFTAKAKT